MPRRRPDGITPSWSLLCKIAASQVGYFTGAQAASAGYSPQLLQYYIQKSLVERTHRGVFHLTRYPREREELMILWLWAKGQGVFSHDTALKLHGLLPGELRNPLSLTLPEEWRRKRLRLPEPAHLFYEEVPREERHRVGPFLATTPLRTLADCLTVDLDRALVNQAVKEAIRQRVITRRALERELGRRASA